MMFRRNRTAAMNQKTRNESDIREFLAAVNKCTRAVWVVSPEGDAFNMKEKDEFARGLSKWAGDRDNQVEIFTSGQEDEMVMMDFYQRVCA